MGEPTDEGLLPDYDNPPVVETILGVQFERLSEFKNAHLGAFWKTLDIGKWPHVVDARPLEPQFERFTESAKWATGIQLQITQDPSSRIQIKSFAGDQMIQVQNGRLHFNWMGQAGGTYIRYAQVRDGFVAALEQFLRFVAQERLGDVRPNQWEVTYLNQIPSGTVWNKPADWGFFRPLAAATTAVGTLQQESFSGAWHFVIPEQRGRLHLQWQHGLKPGPELKEMVVLTLTSRGPLSADGDWMQAVLDGLNLGRQTIVQSFRELMSDQANRHWGLKNAGK